MSTAEKAAFAKRVASDVFGPDALALLSKELPCAPDTRGHAIAYAENAAGETIGKRDAAPGVDWTLIAWAKAWNDRVYGRTQPDASRTAQERVGAARVPRPMVNHRVEREALVGLPRRF